MLKEKIGFKLIHQVSMIESIEYVKAGSFTDDSGASRDYSSSVKFVSKTVKHGTDDEGCGIKDKVTEIEYKIPCKDEAEVKVLNNWLRTTDFTTAPLQFFASIPVMVKKRFYSATTDLDGISFMNAYTTSKKSK